MRIVTDSQPGNINAPCGRTTVYTSATCKFQGNMLQEVRQTFNNHTSQVIRLRINERHAEFEFTVGPIPVG